MMRNAVMLITALLVLASGTVMAEKMYKWVDSQGNISYHDRPPPADSGYRVEEKKVGATRTTDGSGPKLPVVFYSVPKCSPCDAARLHLQKRNIPFTEKSVEKDTKLQEELKAKAGALSVPTILVGSKVLNTYAEGWLDSELDQAGYGKLEADKPAVEKSAEETPGEDDGFKAPVE